MQKIQRALLSVFDKTGLVPFAQTLAAAGVELISTGGTAKVLRENGLTVTDLSDYTGFPEMLDGRVKTLHPKIHGALMALDTPEHTAEREQYGIPWIDLVCVDLYPLQAEIMRPGCTVESVIEKTDVPRTATR